MTQKKAKHIAEMMFILCVAIFWVVNASSGEKSCLQFSIPTGSGAGGEGGVSYYRLKSQKPQKPFIVTKMMNMMSSGGPFSQRSNLKIAAGAVIFDGSILMGDITIGAGTVVHQRARIIAEAGPIFIGEGNVVNEMATIMNRLPPGTNEWHTGQTQIIGNGNVFGIDSMCEALRIGNGNVLETKASIGRDVELTNGCVIGAGCKLEEKTTLRPGTVIQGCQYQR